MPTSMKTAHVRQDHEQKERVRIAKGKRRVGRVQFNALAIILLLGVYPFAIGFIVNAGSSTDGPIMMLMMKNLMESAFGMRTVGRT